MGDLVKETGGNPWGYALVADSDIKKSVCFAGLMARSRTERGGAIRPNLIGSVEMANLNNSSKHRAR